MASFAIYTVRFVLILGSFSTHRLTDSPTSFAGLSKHTNVLLFAPLLDSHGKFICVAYYVSEMGKKYVMYISIVSH